jgi:peptide/nickel transport system ATP-binding protein
MGERRLNSAAPLLAVSGLRVAFQTSHGLLPAVDDVSFTLAQGEILGVVGESGAGKSMTGAAILGLIPEPGRMTGGEIRLAGERIDNIGPAAMRRLRGARIGAIFQDHLASLDPLFTIGDQLIETIRVLRRLGAAQAREEALALLAKVGIPSPAQRLRSYPHQMSGGMRQRVVIALALCGEPSLLIADEPTTALDVSVQAQIIRLLRRLCQESGVAVLLVTHDMGVIADAADRVVVMYAGRVVEVGPARHILRQPRHPYTAGLMSAIPRIDRDHERLRQIEGAMPRLWALPPGCAFQPRCPEAFARCLSERPDLVAVDEGVAACWRHGPDGDATLGHA